MVGLPKPLKKVAKKLDIRVHPDPELAKKFDPDCGRRYINVSLNMISFFNGVAEKVDDEELMEYAREIEQAAYHRDAEKFETYTSLYKHKLGEMGLWKSTKGIGAYQKMKVLNQFRKIGKKAKEQEKESEQNKKKVQASKSEYKDRGDF